MLFIKTWSWRWFLVAFIMAGGWSGVAAPVEIQSLPDGGIQPQVELGPNGEVHLLFFKGDPQNGNVYYAKQGAGDRGFGKPIRVNHREGSAMAIGTIRGAHLALGRKGRPHVVWNASGQSHDGDYMTAPLFYTRMNAEGSAFETERNVITYAYGLDGGSSVAADAQGRVHVVWHASPPGNKLGEAGRAVFMATSTDDGQQFARERVVSPAGTGACGCCGLKAYADPKGNTYVLYRGAKQGTDRDEILLAAAAGSGEFQEVYAHPWKLTACPMSSAFIGSGSMGILAAWETQGQVYLTSMTSQAFSATAALVSPPGEGKRKHPVAARNAAGETLLVWLEGSGWNQGGALAWQIFDAQGQPTAKKGREGKLPVWSFAACYARSDGQFVILR